MTITEIKQANKKAGFHWFDKDTMECWGTKIESQVYSGPGGVFFVTSGWDGFRGKEQGKRAYSVRGFNPETSQIKTIGQLGQYTRDKAKDKAKELARAGCETIQKEFSWEAIARRFVEFYRKYL